MTQQNLPYYTTEFVGRSAEVQEISDRLQEFECRLLTLIGLGGAGKTRLAIQVAVNQHNQFNDGVFFVNLQPIRKAENIVLPLADALQFQFYEATEPEQQILDYLYEKQMLLVLDNFEHLIPNFQFIVKLIQNAPNVKLLITSRQALGIQEEWLFPIQGLSFPDQKPILGRDYSAVDLFTSRAHQVRRDFSLKQDWIYVCRICQLVEGMPLAIELAATWLKPLTCEAIANQIQTNIDFLVSSLHNLPDRHKSVRAVFDYSWSMLSTQEQNIFMKLSIFRGDFTLEAVEMIASASLFMLLGLVEKSFLRRTDSGRYHIHELMRQYGLDKLESSEAIVTIQSSHSNYFMNLLERSAERLMGSQQAIALDEIEADYGNIRLAWESAIAQANNKSISSAVESFYWFCIFRGHFQEGITVFEDTLHSKLMPLTWSKVRARQISLMINTGIDNSPQWNHDLERCLTIAHDYQDVANIGFCLSIMGLKELTLGNFVQSRTYYQQSFEAYQYFGNDFYIARMLRQIGYVYLHEGKIEEAEAPLRDSLILARQCGDSVTEGDCLYNLGSIAGFRNDFDGLLSGYEAALRIRRGLDDRASIALNLGGLASGFFCRGDLDKANIYATEALSIATDINHRESKGQALIWLAYITCISGDYKESQKLFEQSIHLVPENNKFSWVLLGQALLACSGNDYELAQSLLRSALVKMPLLGGLYIPIAVTIWAFILIAEDELEQGISITSYVLHHPSKFASFIEKWSWFLRLEQHLKSDLGEKRFSDAWEYGKTLVLEEIVDEMKAEFLPSQSKHQDEETSEAMIVANKSLDEPLTEREHEILMLIAQGLSNQEIADQLYIAKSTVKRHINNCYGKLGVNSRTKAILKAQKLQLVDSTPPIE